MTFDYVIRAAFGAWVVGLCLTCTAMAQGTEPSAAADQALQPMDLFLAGEHGYTTFRIPSLAITNKGTILAVCAGRRDGSGDWADIDTCMRRSTDGGKSFEPMRVLTDDGRNVVDNATLIVDPNSDRIYLLYQINYSRAYLKVSEDDGQNWSAPQEITDAFETFRTRDDYNWTVIAPGPNNGVVLPSGRLVVPVWLALEHSHRPSIVGTIYSDNRGETWHAGDVIVRDSKTTPNPSETALVLTQDGGVLALIRNESTRYRKLVSRSANGATGWTEPAFQDDLYEPICLAALARVHDGAIVMTHPDSSDLKPLSDPNRKGRRRENVTVRMSTDDGRTWPYHRVIEPHHSGYSALAVNGDGLIFCLLERGTLDAERESVAPDRLTLVRFDPAWIKDSE